MSTGVSAGLTEPLPRWLRRGLRASVFELRDLGRSKAFPALLSLGVPGGPRLVWLIPTTPTDVALRAELVAALLLRARGVTGTPVCWLTRSGHSSWHELEALWLPAARLAYDEAGVPLVWVSVTRCAWWDPRSDLSTHWKRPRVR